MTVLFSLHSLVTNCMTLCVDAESKPDVGSSNSRIDGSDSSSMAMLSRRFWPPEMPLRKISPTSVCSHTRSPISSMTVCTRSTMCWCVMELGRLSLAAISSVSSTVNEPSSESSWAT